MTALAESQEFSLPKPRAQRHDDQTPVLEIEHRHQGRLLARG